MNAVARVIVSSVGLLALLCGSGCAVGSVSGNHDDEATSSGALTGATETTVEDQQSTMPAPNENIRLPQRLTRPLVSAPGTDNSKPADPSPWIDPHGTK